MGRKVQTLENLYSRAIEVNGCLEWQGCLDKDGYGVSSILGVKMPAHRAVYILSTEETPLQYVLHNCHNRKCINFWHLYLGDQKQNVQDQLDQDTFVHGSRNGRALLDEEKVKYARESGKSTRDLATLFNVSYYTMWDVLKGRSWQRVK